MWRKRGRRPICLAVHGRVGVRVSVEAGDVAGDIAIGGDGGVSVGFRASPIDDVEGMVGAMGGVGRCVDDGGEVGMDLRGLEQRDTGVGVRASVSVEAAARLGVSAESAGAAVEGVVEWAMCGRGGVNVMVDGRFGG